MAKLMIPARLVLLPHSRASQSSPSAKMGKMWLLLPFMVSLFILHDRAQAECEPTTCGNLTLRYPFWLGGSNQSSSSCGHPAFEVLCSGDGSKASLKGSSIHVLHIDYANSSFVASHTRVAGGNDGVCRTDFNLSSSILLSPFKISRQNRALCFLYNCNGTEPHGPGYVNVTSGSNCSAPIFAYLGGSYDWDGPPAIATGQCTYTYLPVLGSEAAAMEAARNYSRLLKDGFILEWEEAGIGNCAACNVSGGQCRYDNAAAAFVCLCPHGKLRGSTCADGTRNIKLILIVCLPATTAMLLTCLIWITHRSKQNLRFFNLQQFTRDETETEEVLKRYQSLALKRFKYSALKKITRSFKDKLGEGGYGMVFKGSLEDGRTVAVKLLQGSKGNGEQFLNEVISIRSTSHVNIVSLIGFCLQGSKRALIYEYMANGSLDKHIYSDNSKQAIGWETLQQIAIGIARGLEYLHRGCSTRIIHFDIKPHNILLDEHFCPKIADFGLAKLCSVKDSALSMAEARGTIGFISPEVFSRGFGLVSTKSDVYSFGMVLLEMVGGMHTIEENAENSSGSFLPNLIYDRVVEEMQRYEVTCETEGIVRKMTLIGLWCIQTTPAHRPSMSRVIEMFERNINELEIPPKPFISCSSLPPYFSSEPIYDSE